MSPNALTGLCAIVLHICCAKAESNLAEGKPSDASYLESRPPSVLNDGKPTATTWGSGSCLALSDSDPWWQVDLQGKVIVTKIKVTSRSDCCPWRLRDFSIDVYEMNPSLHPNTVGDHCHYYAGIIAVGGATITVPCDNAVTGRFLRVSGKISKSHNNPFQLCEVQVFGVAISRLTTCASFVQYKGKRFNKTPSKTIRVDNNNRATCASECEHQFTCAGFNIRYEPEVTCELIDAAAISAQVSDAAWDCYLYEPCPITCV
ncbi:uncharacterized protein LOC124145713 [Haliotis rufescens]|uniref:uncharacterized protein LOC124145713 n=1 Tax=Haliotis rufescens TaxID=6454 RepID=UPI001EAF948B|nr:uncharacterized protein LOC124145713 [Haliotis rufescens]